MHIADRKTLTRDAHKMLQRRDTFVQPAAFGALFSIRLKDDALAGVTEEWLGRQVGHDIASIHYPVVRPGDLLVQLLLKGRTTGSWAREGVHAVHIDPVLYEHARVKRTQRTPQTVAGNPDLSRRTVSAVKMLR